MEIEKPPPVTTPVCPFALFLRLLRLPRGLRYPHPQSHPQQRLPSSISHVRGSSSSSSFRCGCVLAVAHFTVQVRIKVWEFISWYTQSGWCLLCCWGVVIVVRDANGIEGEEGSGGLGTRWQRTFLILLLLTAHHHTYPVPYPLPLAFSAAPPGYRRGDPRLSSPAGNRMDARWRIAVFVIVKVEGTAEKYSEVVEVADMVEP